MLLSPSAAIFHYYKLERATKMQISAISHLSLPRLATSRHCTERTSPPWHALAFSRLVNSRLVLPYDPSHLPIVLTHDKPSPQSRAQHFRGKIQPLVSTVMYRQVRIALLVSRFARWRMRVSSTFSVFRFHSFFALLVCSDYYLFQPYKVSLLWLSWEIKSAFC